ncbi:putative transporter YgaY [Fusarium oxysporum f. sp. albedinis]|nr:putative transporter YgaY [Fusarium oxysporum f. sp. albedinis]
MILAPTLLDDKLDTAKIAGKVSASNATTSPRTSDQRNAKTYQLLGTQGKGRDLSASQTPELSTITICFES